MRWQKSTLHNISAPDYEQDKIEEKPDLFFPHPDLWYYAEPLARTGW